MKKQFHVPAAHHEWNYLTGVGPSAPVPSNEPLEPKCNFKPGWKVKRMHATIQPENQRLEHTAHVEKRREANEEVRRAQLTEKATYNGFNPIRCEEFDPSKNRDRPQGRKSLPERPAPPPEVVAKMEAQRFHKAEARKHLLATEGLTPQQKGPSVRDNFSGIQ
mmetsp:Transcript_8677/g.28600  ORF Transcript_8677/g.28600 Transcript_8677/m.28600 type:complete len:163 (+) Transcript_8677:29-517(+)|eukprot:CAMPEP_0170133656 /NCGR_PEP_ID=MMETSP0033_2-20121228/1453_1 /TAXON_ID=195969 /ORGANISM="Dolichomastix tenuilepis, Strain CCMP3274" /LENGTH=162 /DNA_ID=CAMNT_0010369165 /DNA_START=29 /DNA_END=517 /DNA_ORIENTATION=+